MFFYSKKRRKKHVFLIGSDPKRDRLHAAFLVEHHQRAPKCARCLSHGICVYPEKITNATVAGRIAGAPIAPRLPSVNVWWPPRRTQYDRATKVTRPFIQNNVNMVSYNMDECFFIFWLFTVVCRKCHFLILVPLFCGPPKKNLFAMQILMVFFSKNFE